MKTTLFLLVLMGFLIQIQAQTVTDIDGNKYQTVTVGTQIWMKENLKSTKFNDGIPIAFVKDNSSWGNLTSPGYCWYNDSLSKYKNTYGALYNWYACSRRLCPKDWHVPSDDEWAVLINHLGGENIAGGKLKEKNSAHWRRPNIASDSSNFTALPGGYRSTDGLFITVGAFDALGIGGGWWSTAMKDNKNSWGRTIYFNTGRINRVSNLNTVGFSVRCLKDN